MRKRLLVMVGTLLGCSSSPADGPADGDASGHAAPEAGSDTLAEATGADAPDPADAAPDGIVDAMDAADASADGDDDAGADGAADASEAGPYVPVELRAGLIHAGPVRVSTPPTWNAHLPKLAGDGAAWYAVHTHYPQDVAGRYAAIMRRIEGAPLDAWSEVARVSYPHQPPGIVIDTSRRLHMVFDCLRPGAADVTCFQGGAGTGGNTSRFYHLVFASRDAGDQLRMDTYANHNEWTAESNGYHGIGTTADGTTVWALADGGWGRVVQWWASGTQYGTTATLTVPDAYLLYPIVVGHPLLGSGQLTLYAGEFDPGGGSNASYVASTAFAGSTSSFWPLFRRAPSQPQPGTTQAYPSDLAYDEQGTLYALSYLPDGAGGCTELLRFAGGLGQPPDVLPVGCVSNYAKLKFASDGTLYLITPGSAADVSIGVSVDRGTSWTWHTIPISGLPDNGDTRYVGFTPVKEYHSPTVHEPDRWVLLFAGMDASGEARNSYVGVVDLAP